MSVLSDPTILVAIIGVVGAATVSGIGFIARRHFKGKDDDTSRRQEIYQNLIITLEPIGDVHKSTVTSKTLEDCLHDLAGWYFKEGRLSAFYSNVAKEYDELKGTLMEIIFDRQAKGTTGPLPDEVWSRMRTAKKALISKLASELHPKRGWLVFRKNKSTQ